MIAIVDTGGANLTSVTNALDRLDTNWVITKDEETIRSASHVLLPGVGAAADSMSRIEKDGLVEIITSLKQPVLGICLGMQLLFERSEEGNVSCLNIIPGEVKAIPKKPLLSIPHMGWNQVHYKSDSVLFEGIPENSHFYFIHSFMGTVNEFTIGYTQYGQEVPALVQKDNFYGAQFHPEKSGEAGSQFLRNFLKL